MSFVDQVCLTSQTRPQPAQASNEIINGDSGDQNSQPAITNREHGKKTLQKMQTPEDVTVFSKFKLIYLQTILILDYSFLCLDKYVILH